MAYDTIGDFKNLHNGQKAFILASGPSLANLDLSPLRRRVVIGLNRSALIYPDTHYHCTMDSRLFEEFEEVLRKTRYLFTFEDRPFGIPIRLLGSEGFSWDLEEGIYSGYTVAYYALQVAIYMGFEHIFYLGLDLKHEQGRTHFFGKDFVSLNHERTEFPKMTHWLARAAKLLEDSPIEVYNCSMESTLTCFPKVSYEWALAQ